MTGDRGAGSDDDPDVGEAGDVGPDIAADEQQIGRGAGPDPPSAITDDPAGVGCGGGGGRERHRGGCAGIDVERDGVQMEPWVRNDEIPESRPARSSTPASCIRLMVASRASRNASGVSPVR